MEMLFCVNAHVLHHLADCPHGSCTRTFLKPGRKCRPCSLVWAANLHTLRIHDAITPPLDLEPSIS